MSTSTEKKPKRDQASHITAQRAGFVPTRHPGFFFWLSLLYLAILVMTLVARDAGWLWLDRLPASIGGIVPLGVLWFGALGAVTISLYGVFDHNKEWDSKWNYWHLARPIAGMVLGTIGYLIFVSLINATGVKPITQVKGVAGASAPQPADLVPYYVLAFLLGFREQTFRELIQRAVDILFGPGIPGVTPPPGVGVSPAPLEFGTVPKNQTKEATVTVTNTGAGNLIVNRGEGDKAGVSISDGAAFALVDETLSGAVIPPGGAQVLSIRYHPTEDGKVDTGTLRIRSNAGVREVSLVGTGAPDA